QREPRDLASAVRLYCGQEHPAHRAAQDVRAAAAVLDAQLARYRDLPRTVPALHRRLVDVDVGGWFRCEAGCVGFAVGQDQGRPLTEAAAAAPDYLLWMLNQGLLDDARHLVEQAVSTAAVHGRPCGREERG